jgi:hypothetical protein
MTTPMRTAFERKAAIGHSAHLRRDRHPDDRKYDYDEDRIEDDRDEAVAHPGHSKAAY